MTLADGYATAQQATASLSTIIAISAEPRRLSKVVVEQSQVWDNWETLPDVTPAGLRNAYVFLPVKAGDCYLLAMPPGSNVPYPAGMSEKEKRTFRKEWLKDNPEPNNSNCYHAWHSTDMANWTHCGQISNSRWVTTAEYADGQFYIYYDEPNDQDPHLIIDDNLKDGIVGKEMGCVFPDPTHGSDIAAFRDEDGTFHLIYEDWSPIDASKNAWDSPLAGRVSSPDGITGFTFGQHPNVVDHRTTPTGATGTFKHGASAAVNNGSPVLTYHVHEPAQDAYGDWTMIKIGKHYHLFCDYDSADHAKSMRMGRFTSPDLNQEFTWSGEIGEGFHPDPSIGFAEGKFYAIMQRETDFVSPGPWVDGVEARAGVDTDGDGTIDQWTEWQRIAEAYSHKPGFARIVDVAPATLDASNLPAGLGFQLELRTQALANGVQPIIDRIEATFK
jgi:hypothetical protein